MTATKLDASIVVPAYNAEQTIEGCLRALLAQQGCRCEIILVDDGSTDSTGKRAEAFAPNVRVIREAHRGVSAARNRGIAEAQSEIILFTDADCEPTPGWAAALVKTIRGGADGAKGVYRTHQKALVARWTQAEYASRYRRTARMESIDFIDTYSAAYRRDALQVVGGFDEQIMVDEDQDLSFRMVEQGYTLCFVPEAVVYHTHVSTIKGYARRKFKIGYWKVLVAARHPARAVSDSHTLQSIKAQMALLALTAIAAPAAPFSRNARRICTASGAALLATTLPLAYSVARTDLTVGLLAPVMCLIRAAALLAGTAAGIVRFGPELVLRRRR